MFCFYIFVIVLMSISRRFGLLFVLLSGALLASCGTSVDTSSLAQCVTEKGWVMYGVNTCPHCMEQKKVLGSSFDLVEYVECSENPQICDVADIKGYPTWVNKQT